MKIKTLCQGLSHLVIHGNKDTVIYGMTEDSRSAAPGFLFFDKTKNPTFVEEAIASGAKAIVSDWYNPFIKIPQIIVPSVFAIEGILASRFFGDPSQKLYSVGITGTKGKTTTTYLVHHLLESLAPSGLMNTVEVWQKNRSFPSSLTTHDVIFNHRTMHEMVQHGCKQVVIEVSSHGLDQGRLDGIAFNLGIFTNLSPDHLDYHKTVENYAAAKAKLFTKVKDTVICNADDPFSSWMQGGKKRVLFGIEKGDLRAENVVCTEEGVSFTIHGVLFRSHLRGKFNVYNLLATIAVGLEKGMGLSQIAHSLEQFSQVPGRLERVFNGKGVHVFVDYAHTGDSLRSVLETLKSSTSRRLIVVFGCGGNRDPQRRPLMGKAANVYADLSIITMDNPRKEDPEAICRDILSGFSSLEKTVVEMDRKKAIHLALSQAEEGDTVLIAGKGHEKTQIFADRTIPFDDVLVVKEFFMQ